MVINISLLSPPIITINNLILSFKGAFHGRTVGLLSCSNSRPIQGVDIPSLNWPKADFPVYKYPLEENLRENEAEDARCLARVEEILAQSSAEGQPVAGVISEPIQVGVCVMIVC